MKAFGLFVAATVGVLGFAAAGARGDGPTDVYLTLTLQVDPTAQTWQAFGQITGDTTQTSGLKGLQFDVTGAGGVQIGSGGVDTTINDMPVGWTDSFLTGFYQFRYKGTFGEEIRGDQTSEYETDGEQNNVLTDVGIAGQTQSGVTWGVPVLLANGTYTGSGGSLTVAGYTVDTTFLPATMPTPTSEGTAYQTFSPVAVNSQTVQIPNPSISSTGIAWIGPRTGSWDTTGANWSTGSAGSPFNAAWSNNPNRCVPNRATFGNGVFPGTNAVTVNSNIDVGSITFANYGSWVVAGGTGVLAYGGTGAISIVAGYYVDTINAVIADGSSFGVGGGVTSIVYSGPGELVLGGANTYSGSTTVNAGLFVVSNVSGSATGGGNVLMNGGRLEGSGSIAGTVQGSAGSGPWTIDPDVGFGSGKLTVGGLTISAKTTLIFDGVRPGSAHSGAGSVSNMLNITGNNALTITGGTVAFTTQPAGAGSLGYYRIMEYSGAIEGAGIGSLVLPATVNQIAYVLDTKVDPGFVDVHRGLLGDANDDGVVNSADNAVLSANFGEIGAGWGGGDFNNDGVTNFADFALLSNNFGETIGGNDTIIHAAGASGASSGVASGVPEPGSLALLAMGAGLVVARRRREGGG